MASSVLADQWKPRDTTGNHVVPQRDFGGVAAVQLATLASQLLGRVSISGAINEALRHDGRTDLQLAEAMSISKGYMSKLVRSVWAAQLKRLVKFMRETRHIGVLQVLAHEMGCEVVVMDSQAAHIAALKAEVARLEGRAA